MPDDVVQQGCVKDGSGVELLPRNCGSHHCEDSRTDHRADAKGGQRNGAQGFFQSTLGVFRVRDQFVDGLAAEELIIQRNAPRLK
jgi:hypothetical protein